MASELLARGTHGAHDATVTIVDGSVVVSAAEHRRQVSVDEAWLRFTPPDLSFSLILSALLASVSVMWLAVADEHGVASLIAILGIAVAVLWAVWAIKRLRWLVALGTRAEFALFAVSLTQKKSWVQLEAHLANASAVTRAWQRQPGVIGSLVQALRLISDPSEAQLRKLWSEEMPILSFTDWAPVRLRRAWAFVLLSCVAPLLTGLAVAALADIVRAVVAAIGVRALGSWLGDIALKKLEEREGSMGTLRPMFPALFDPKMLKRL